jgi:hypothetical protein
MANVSIPVDVAQELGIVLEEDPHRTRTHTIRGLIEGRSVHYVSTKPRHMAAIIARVIDDVTGLCELQVQRVGGMDGSVNVESDFDPSGTQPGTWHWIEHVE